MEQINELIEDIDAKQNIHFEDIPNIDLYMDQVIQLFETNFKNSKRNENDKILTKTMINNYAKGKLFIPVKNKKYSKDHIMLISLIYQLKGALSIGDIKSTLDGINEKVTLEDFDLEHFYKSYLALFENNTESIKEILQEKVRAVQEEISQSDKDAEYLEKVLLIASLVNMSNLYRKTAEKLVDTLK